jgi:hypothetical protein
MKNLLLSLENIWVAVTFAEVGEYRFTGCDVAFPYDHQTIRVGAQ